MAETVTTVLVQVSGPVLVAVTFWGGATSWVTVVEAAVVQPLGAVTVTEYVPATEVVNDALVWPLLQR